MLHLKRQDFDDLDHLHRINLINSCSGFKSANLIGTKSNDGIPNVAIFSSVTHFGSNPPLLGIIFRPVSDVPRNTYENIKETGQFTINHIHRDIIEQAHHTSAKYDKRISEFDVTELEEEYKIKANNTIQLIAEIKDLYVKDELIEKDGFINLSKANVMTINGLDGYALPSLKQRIDYQRPIK